MSRLDDERFVFEQQTGLFRREIESVRLYWVDSVAQRTAQRYLDPMFDAGRYVEACCVDINLACERIEVSAGEVQTLYDDILLLAEDLQDALSDVTVSLQLAEQHVHQSQQQLTIAQHHIDEVDRLLALAEACDSRTTRPAGAPMLAPLFNALEGAIGNVIEGARGTVHGTIGAVEGGVKSMLPDP